MRLPAVCAVGGNRLKIALVPVVLGGILSAFLLPTAADAAAAEEKAGPEEAVFEMREVSAFDKNDHPLAAIV